MLKSHKIPVELLRKSRIKCKKNVSKITLAEDTHIASLMKAYDETNALRPAMGPKDVSITSHVKPKTIQVVRGIYCSQTTRPKHACKSAIFAHGMTCLVVF